MNTITILQYNKHLKNSKIISMHDTEGVLQMIDKHEICFIWPNTVRVRMTLRVIFYMHAVYLFTINVLCFS